jgi:hypothetical protein
MAGSMIFIRNQVSNLLASNQYVINRVMNILLVRNLIDCN